MTIAGVTRMAGEYDEAMTWLQEALAIAISIGDLELENYARLNLGTLHHLIGDATGSLEAYRAAEGFYLANLEASMKLETRQQQVICHANLAELYLRLGRPNDVGAHLDRALRDALDIGRTADLGICLIIEAELRLSVGDVEGALMLVGALQSDPRAGEEDQQEIERLLQRANLDDEVVRLGTLRGQGCDIVELGQAIAISRAGRYFASRPVVLRAAEFPTGHSASFGTRGPQLLSEVRVASDEPTVANPCRVVLRGAAGVGDVLLTEC